MEYLEIRTMELALAANALPSIRIRIDGILRNKHIVAFRSCEVCQPPISVSSRAFRRSEIDTGGAESELTERQGDSDAVMLGRPRILELN